MHRAFWLLGLLVVSFAARARAQPAGGGTTATAPTIPAPSIPTAPPIPTAPMVPTAIPTVPTGSPAPMSSTAIPAGPAPRRAADAAAGLRQQQLAAQYYAWLQLYSLEPQASAGPSTTTRGDLDRASASYMTNGAEATSVPTSGPAAAYFSNGADVLS